MFLKGVKSSLKRLKHVVLRVLTPDCQKKGPVSVSSSFEPSSRFPLLNQVNASKERHPWSKRLNGISQRVEEGPELAKPGLRLKPEHTIAHTLSARVTH